MAGADRDDRGRAEGRSRGESPKRNDSRLDQPREIHRRLLPRPSYNRETFGRASERFARFMGTATFLVYMSGFVLIWVLWNSLSKDAGRFDAYPFIFLTLMLSLQASYAAPLILLAQNRQADRERVGLEQDRARDERNLADTEYLTREVAALRITLREMATRDFVRSELRDLLEEMQERGLEVSSGTEPDGGGGGGGTGAGTGRGSGAPGRGGQVRGASASGDQRRPT